MIYFKIKSGFISTSCVTRVIHRMRQVSIKLMGCNAHPIRIMRKSMVLNMNEIPNILNMAAYKDISERSSPLDLC